MNFINKHKIMLSVIFILIIIASFGIYRYKNMKANNIKAFEYQIELCETGYYDSFEDVSKENYCALMEEGLNNAKVKEDTIWLFFNLIDDYPIWYLQIFGIFLVIIPAIYVFNNELKSEYYKNILMRMEYDKYIKKSILSSYKYALIFPIFLLCLFCASYIISGHFDLISTLQIKPNTLHTNEIFINNMLLFLITYFINMFLHGILWINLSYMVVKKSKNFILTIILTFMLYIGIEVVFQIFIGQIPQIFGIGKNIINYVMMFNIWNYKNVDNIFIKLLMTIIYLLISFTLLKIIYKNKEEVIIENE